MELDELKTMWGNHYQKAEQQVSVNAGLLKALSLSKIKSHLWEFRLTAITELIANLLLIFFLWGFMASHLFEWEFLVPAMFLCLLSTVDLIWNIYCLYEIQSLNFGMSITEIQRKIYTLQLYSRYEIRSLYIAIPLFAACFVILVPKVLFGFSIYPYLGIHWYYHLLGTIALTPLIVWFVGFFPDKGLIKAKQFLEDIVNFEKTEE